MRFKILKGRSAGWWGCAAVLGAAFLAMFLFNILTPLISDDYTYLLRYPTSEPVENFGDIIESQIVHYMQWGGRTIVISLNQIFLWLGKWLFNPLNAAMFCVFVWACAKLAVGRRPVHPLLLVVVLAALVHFNPCFGAVNLWLCGSCGYLWPLALCLLFLLPYRLALDGLELQGAGAAVGIFFLGLAAGWGNENTSGMAVLAAAIFLVLLRIFLKKVPLWAWTGAAVCLTGFLLLMCAPGQWVRFEYAGSDGRSFLTVYATRIMNATHSLFLYGAWLLVAFGALYGLLLLTKPGAKALVLPAVFCLLGLAANYALILSPVYYIRSFYPVLAMLVCANASCIAALAQTRVDTARLLRGALAGLFSVVLAYDLLIGGYDILNYFTMRLVRDGEITAAVQAGETDVETYAVFPYTRFCGAWGQPDIRQDPGNWVNKNMALHLGAGSIRAVEQHYYPFPGYDDFSNTVDKEMSLALE